MKGKKKIKSVSSPGGVNVKLDHKVERALSSSNLVMQGCSSWFGGVIEGLWGNEITVEYCITSLLVKDFNFLSC